MQLIVNAIFSVKNFVYGIVVFRSAALLNSLFIHFIQLYELLSLLEYFFLGYSLPFLTRISPSIFILQKCLPKVFVFSIFTCYMLIPCLTDLRC